MDDKKISKKALKQIIVDMVADEYIHKDEIRKLLTETSWSDEKDYKIRYIKFYKSIARLL